jgi:mRNA-degrading endonuclease toxin of MazEF toxin-antitoxin module
MEITRVEGGLRFRSSLHDDRVTVTRSGDRVRFEDTAARVVRALPRRCRLANAEAGRAVLCRIPADISAGSPLRIDVEPGGGNDQVDGSTLGVEIRLDVLGAAGDDDIATGAGADSVNGAGGIDTVRSGDGNDFVRVGDGDDIADGGTGDDHILGTAGNDQLTGNTGDDVLEGGDGNDLLLGGTGEDSLLCGNGIDTTDDDGDTDRPHQCENTIP